LDMQLRRSHALSERGFARLMLCVSLLSLFAGGVLWLIGAWPVIGFMGMDALLIYLAFRHYRAQLYDQYEHIYLDAEHLKIHRHYGRRDEVIALEPAFLHVLHSEERDPLVVVQRGREFEIGSWLAPIERHWFAQTLRRALRERLQHLPHLP